MPDPNDLHGFDASGAARIVQAVRRVEAMSQRPRISGQLGVPNWQLVRVTDDEGCDNSSADSSGDSAESSVRYYPAALEMWDATNEEAEDVPDGVVWLIERHGYPLIVGNTYMAQMSGDKTICGEMRTVFITAIGVAGLDDQTADNYDGSVDSADSTDAYTSDVEYCDSAGPGGEVTLPLMSCDEDGNQCIKLVKFRSSGSLQICIEDPNDCD